MNLPKVIGYVDIPKNLKAHNDGFYREIANALVPGKALLIEYDNFEQLKKGRRCVLNAAMYKFGSGHIRTASEDVNLYVWLKNGTPSHLEKIETQELLSGLFIEDNRK